MALLLVLGAAGYVWFINTPMYLGDELYKSYARLNYPQYQHHQGGILTQRRINTHNRLTGSHYASRCEDGEEGKVEERTITYSILFSRFSSLYVIVENASTFSRI